MESLFCSYPQWKSVCVISCSTGLIKSSSVRTGYPSCFFLSLSLFACCYCFLPSSYKFIRVGALAYIIWKTTARRWPYDKPGHYRAGSCMVDSSCVEKQPSVVLLLKVASDFSCFLACYYFPLSLWSWKHLRNQSLSRLNLLQKLNVFQRLITGPSLQWASLSIHLAAVALKIQIASTCTSIMIPVVSHQSWLGLYHGCFFHAAQFKNAFFSNSGARVNSYTRTAQWFLCCTTEEILCFWNQREYITCSFAVILG